MRSLIALIVVIAATPGAEAQELDFWRQTSGPLGPSEPALPKLLPDGRLFMHSTGIGRVYCSDDSGRTYRRCNKGIEQIQTSLLYTDSSTVFMTTMESVYRSTDYGSSWQPINNGFAPGSTHGYILLSPHSRTIFAMVIDRGFKMYRSSNRGDTWQLWLDQVANPVSPVMAMTAGGHGIVNIDGRNYRSSDYGVTWKEDGVSPFGAGARWFPLLAAVGDTFVAGEWKGTTLQRSTDFGLTWQPIEALSQGRILEDLYRAWDGRLIALFDDRSLHLSEDGGATWQQVGRTPTPKYINNPNAYVTLVGETIIVRLPDYQLYRSSDMGTTWSEVWVEPYPSTVPTVLLEEQGTIMAVERKGDFFRTTDLGDSWDSAGRVTQQAGEGVQALVHDNRGALLAGTFGLNGGSVYRSTDRGRTWRAMNVGLFGTTVVSSILPLGGDTLVIATDNGIFRSVSNGEVWTQSVTGLPTLGIRTLVQGESGAIIAGTNAGLWRSTDNGQTWHDRNNAVDDNLIRVMLVTRDGMILAASEADGTIYRTTDEGDNWRKTTVDPGVVGHRVAAFAEDSAGVLYAGTAYVIEAANRGFLMRSTDRGESWSIAAKSPINARSSLLISSDGYLYGGINAGGVWRSIRPVTSSTPHAGNPSSTMQLQADGDMIRYRVATSGSVRLLLYDTQGRTIRTLLDADQQSGDYHLAFETADLADGIYFLHLRCAGQSATQPVVVMH